MVVENDSFLRSLREIRDKAANLRKLTEQALALRGMSTSHSSSPLPTPIPTLNLPLPTDMGSLFNDIDLSDSVIAELTLKVQGWVTKIQHLYQQRFESTCQQLLAIPQSSNGQLLMDKIKNICQTFQRTYLDRELPRINRRIILLRSQLPRSCTIDKKSLFKNEHRPLLDKYFQFNAYPSSQERLNLARKTRMTPRQIEVWFQNHRNRSKKDGKSLPRRGGPPPDFETWDTTVGNSPLDAESDDELSDTAFPVNSPSRSNSQHCSFSSASPPHAFPTKYPPECSTDPFPINNGVFTLPWLRKPVFDVVPRPLTTSAIDELTQMFASKLNLRENASKPRRQTKESPWYSATTVMPCPAPLPSLLRTVGDMPATTLHTMASFRQRDPSFGSPSVLSSAGRYTARLRKAGAICKGWPSFTMFPLSCVPHHSSTPVSSPANSYRSRISSTSSTSSVEPITPTSSQPSSPIIRVLDNIPDFQGQAFETGSLYTNFPFDAEHSLEDSYYNPPYDFSMLTHLIPVAHS